MFPPGSFRTLFPSACLPRWPLLAVALVLLAGPGRPVRRPAGPRRPRRPRAVAWISTWIGRQRYVKHMELPGKAPYFFVVRRIPDNKVYAYTSERHRYSAKRELSTSALADNSFARHHLELAPTFFVVDNLSNDKVYAHLHQRVATVRRRVHGHSTLLPAATETLPGHCLDRPAIFTSSDYYRQQSLCLHRSNGDLHPKRGFQPGHCSNNASTHGHHLRTALICYVYRRRRR